MRRSLLALTVMLVVVAAAAAAVPPAYVTPAAIAAKITGSVPQLAVDNTAVPSTITSTTCRGLGAAHHGKFATFKCAAQASSGKATVWARALAGGRFCASPTGLAACPPPPALPGDPRLCAVTGAPITADPNRCALGSAEAGLVRAMKQTFSDPNWAPRNISCKGANVSFACQFSSFTAYGIYYQSTIVFFHTTGAWQATFKTALESGGSGGTCTEQPAASKGGTAADWSSGPAPTCVTN
jgi:hypothetical protein